MDPGIKIQTSDVGPQKAQSMAIKLFYVDVDCSVYQKEERAI